MCIKIANTSLTKLAFNALLAEVLDEFALVEHVLVDSPTPKKPDVAVVGDGALGLVRQVKLGALCLRLHWAHQVRNTKQPQQLLHNQNAIYTIQKNVFFQMNKSTFQWYPEVMSLAIENHERESGKMRSLQIMVLVEQVSGEWIYFSPHVSIDTVKALSQAIAMKNCSIHFPFTAQ